MKKLFILFFVLLFSNTAFAADDVINGTWAGPATTNQGGVFRITLNIQNGTTGTNVMTWDGGGCSGSLTGSIQGKNTYMYKLQITEGRATPQGTGCVDGMVRLIFDGVKTVQYTWGGVDLAGVAMFSTAVLEKQG